MAHTENNKHSEIITFSNLGNTKLANPAPLGLMGFGMTTILLNLANSGLFAFDVAILAMGIFYGGIAQIFAGLLEFKKAIPLV